MIAAVQPAAVNMSWRLIYAVVISSFLMLVWAMIINVSPDHSQEFRPHRAFILRRTWEDVDTPLTGSLAMLPWYETAKRVTMSRNPSMQQRCRPRKDAVGRWS